MHHLLAPSHATFNALTNRIHTVLADIRPTARARARPPVLSTTRSPWFQSGRAARLPNRAVARLSGDHRRAGPSARRSFIGTCPCSQARPAQCARGRAVSQCASAPNGRAGTMRTPPHRATSWQENREQ